MQLVIFSYNISLSLRMSDHIIEITVELSEAAIKLVIEGVAEKLQEARGGESSLSGEPSERPPTRSGGEKK